MKGWPGSNKALFKSQAVLSQPLNHSTSNAMFGLLSKEMERSLGNDVPYSGEGCTIFEEIVMETALLAGVWDTLGT